MFAEIFPAPFYDAHQLTIHIASYALQKSSPYSDYEGSSFSLNTVSLIDNVQPNCTPSNIISLGIIVDLGHIVHLENIVDLGHRRVIPLSLDCAFSFLAFGKSQFLLIASLPPLRIDLTKVTAPNLVIIPC